MTDDTERPEHLGDVDDDDPDEQPERAVELDVEVEVEPPSYRSGRVRIIGAEPAGNAVHEVTGPVVEENPDMPHWNDAPTGQVPAILDRGNGDEQGVAPPRWREDDTDWAAHEELFEPSMLSDELPAVGSMMNDNNDLVDVERQPWRFDTDAMPSDEDTLQIAPDFPPDPMPVRVVPSAPYVPAGPAVPTGPTGPAGDPGDVASPVTRRPLRRPSRPGARGPDSRLSPPEASQTRARAPRATRLSDEGLNGNSGGTRGRNMQLAWGSGIVLGLATLLCAHFGNLPSMVLITIVILFAAAEGFAAFRTAKYHPATLLGLVGILSLMIETYNKGVTAQPLVLVMLVAATFVWYLTRVEPAADPVAGIASTVFVVAWVGGFGSFGALLLNPTLFPHRHGVAFLLAAVLTTVAADVASLLVGSAFGRHPMAPSISPNKTWEGFLGGAIASVLVAVIVVHFIHPWTIGKALVLGLVVAVVAPIGDLSQSMVKRHLGVKDMSRLMPGHGGILDRVDGLLFVLPATYFVVKAFHLG